MEKEEKKFLKDFGKFIITNIIEMMIVGVIIGCTLPYLLIISYILVGVIGIIGIIVAIIFAIWCLIGDPPEPE